MGEISMRRCEQFVDLTKHLSEDLDYFQPIKVRAIKPIKKGEEILVNYVDVEDFNYGNRESRCLKLFPHLAQMDKCLNAFL